LATIFVISRPSVSVNSERVAVEDGWTAKAPFWRISKVPPVVTNTGISTGLPEESMTTPYTDVSAPEIDQSVPVPRA